MPNTQKDLPTPDWRGRVHTRARCVRAAAVDGRHERGDIGKEGATGEQGSFFQIAANCYPDIYLFI